MEDLDNSDRSPRRRSLDLSVTQVAASSMAAVAGAVLASELGVYGTILGAAVVSAGATVGSALFQHAFRRTGEQLRDLATTPSAAVPVQRPASRRPAGTPAPPFDPFDPGGEHTRMTAATAAPRAEAVAVYRGRNTWRPRSWRPRSWKPRSWKTWALMSVLVFGLAMGTVTAVELVAGKPVAAIVRDEPGSGTSFGGGTVNHSGGFGGTPSTTPSGGASGPAGRPSDGASSGQGADSSSPTPSATPSQGPTPGQSPSQNPSQNPSPGQSPGTGQSGAPAPGPSQAVTQPTP